MACKEPRPRALEKNFFFFAGSFFRKRSATPKSQNLALNDKGRHQNGNLGRYDGITREYTPQHGLTINQSGGMYRNGATYGIEKTLEVARTAYKKQVHDNDCAENLTAIAKQCNVSRNFVTKLKQELDDFGEVIHPGKIVKNRKHGPGANTLDEVDSFILLILYLKSLVVQLNPTLSGYGCSREQLSQSPQLVGFLTMGFLFVEGSGNQTWFHLISSVLRFFYGRMIASRFSSKWLHAG
jgi:hypothetical protein